MTRGSGQATFSGVHITSLGTNPDIGFSCPTGFPQECRWGDYSWTALDPKGQNLWMEAEKIVPQVAIQIIGTQSFTTNWGTWIYEVMGS